MDLMRGFIPPALCICANCKEGFYSDYEEEQLCPDCSEDGWIWLTGNDEDPRDIVFKVDYDKNLEAEAPF